MGSCEYRYVCPITECDAEKSIQCVGRLVDLFGEMKSRKKQNDRVEVEHTETGAEENESRIFYQCDHRACGSCMGHAEGNCDHTMDIRHAKNFEMIAKDFFEIGTPPVEKNDF